MNDRKANVVLGIAISLIMALALAVVFVANKPATPRDPSSPEGAVQAYLKAVVASDYTKAITHLDPASTCKVADLDNSYFAKDVRINLIDSSQTATDATVKISVEIPSGAPIEGYYSEEHTLRLTRSDAGWLITGMPWPMYSCGMVK